MGTNRDPKRDVVSALNSTEVHGHYYHDDKITSSAASQLECTAEERVLGSSAMIKSILIASHEKTKAV